MKVNFDRKNPFHISSILIVFFLLLTIPLTVAVVLNSEQSSRDPKAAVVRDKYTWPFASNSIWNLPIGASAQYVPAGIQNANAWRGEITIDEEFIGVNPNDPVRTINGIQAHVPANMSHDGGWNGCATFVRSSDKDTLISGQPLQLSSGGNGSWQYNYSNPPSGGGNMSLQGDGRYGCHGGSALSGIGGSLRKGELNSSEPIRHALKINLFAKRFLSCSNSGYRWPAFRADAYLSCSTYGGSVAQARMGSLLAVKPDVNCTSTVSSNHARKICKALQDYGGYVVDDTYWDVHALNVSWDAEFGDGGTFHSDVQKIFTMLHVIDNWNQSLYSTVAASNGSQGAGGGTPRVAWAPAFGQSTGETTPPTVSVSSPTNGSTVTGIVAFNATANDNAGGSGMNRVEFSVDGSLINTDTTSPYSFQFDTKTLTNGSRKFRATAFDNAGNSNFNEVTVTVNNTTPEPPGGALPAPWLTTDVGAVGVAGSASYTNGTFTVAGSGSDIWGNTDSFRYVYQSLSGDGSISARITSQENTNSWAKAGVMIRNSTAADSMHAMLVTTPSNGLAFQYRTATTGTTSHTSAGSYNLPAFLKIERVGNTIKALSSTNGTSFTEIGTTTMALNANTTVGLAVLSHVTDLTSQAKFDNVSVSKNTTSAPVISNLSSKPTINSSEITWSTNQPATSQLVYGTTSNYGSSVQPNTTLVTSHKLTISGLAADTNYFYAVTSVNSAGQSSTSTGSFRTSAPTSLGSSVEAEVMKFTSGWVNSSGNIFSDTSASGGKGLVYLGNSVAGSQISGSGNALVITAKADICQGNPNMRVIIGNTTVLVTEVNTTSWKDYIANVNLSAGTHNFSITLDNDYWDGGSCDRNLRIDKISIATLTGGSVGPVTLEAEKSTISSVNGRVYTDSLASEGSAVVLYSNGSVIGNLAGGGNKLTIRVRGDQCNGSPRMIVTVDGKIVGTSNINNISWSDVSYNVALANTAHVVSVSFDNDYWQGRSSNCDRNLRIDKVTLQ